MFEQSKGTIKRTNILTSLLNRAFFEKSSS